MARAKVLVIDHDATWTLTVSELIIADTYEVFSANSAQDAFLLLEVHGIDLIIAEVNMPGQDGTGLLEQIRQMFPQTTLIVHTANASISQAVQSTRLGAQDYLEKSTDPAALSVLREKVRRAVQE